MIQIKGIRLPLQDPSTCCWQDWTPPNAVAGEIGLNSSVYISFMEKKLTKWFKAYNSIGK